MVFTSASDARRSPVLSLSPLWGRYESASGTYQKANFHSFADACPGACANACQEILRACTRAALHADASAALCADVRAEGTGAISSAERWQAEERRQRFWHACADACPEILRACARAALHADVGAALCVDVRAEGTGAISGAYPQKAEVRKVQVAVQYSSPVRAQSSRHALTFSRARHDGRILQLGPVLASKQPQSMVLQFPPYLRERLAMSLLRNIPQAELGGQLKEIGLPLGPRLAMPLGPRLAIVSAIGEE